MTPSRLANITVFSLGLAGITTACFPPFRHDDRDVALLRDRRVPIHYPDLLRTANVDGRVILDVGVDSTGRFDRRHTHIVAETHTMFSNAVRIGLDSMRWRPAVRNGQSVASVRRDTIDFVLLLEAKKRCPKSTEHGWRVCAMPAPVPRRVVY
jgi:hypothetical protein